MKSNLKTLDDIKPRICSGRRDCEGQYDIRQDMKQEAIRWIKELEKITIQENDEYDNIIPRLFGCYCESGYSDTNHNVVEFIKYFFNITEEDIKKYMQK